MDYDDNAEFEDLLYDDTEEDEYDGFNEVDYTDTEENNYDLDFDFF